MIALYNACAYIGDCHVSLQHQVAHEIIVRDNSSIKSGPDLVATHFTTLQLMYNKQNLGLQRPATRAQPWPKGSTWLFSTRTRSSSPAAG